MFALRAAPLRAARAVARSNQVRALHVENVVDHALPTNVTNKTWLAAKMLVYTTCGLGLPFFATYYHNRKAANGGVF